MSVGDPDGTFVRVALTSWSPHASPSTSSATSSGGAIRACAPSLTRWAWNPKNHMASLALNAAAAGKREDLHPRD